MAKKPANKKSSPPAWKWVSFQFSLNGLIYICLTLFMGLAALNSGQNLLYGVFGLMIGILLIAITLSRRMLVRLSVHRHVPDHGIVGRPVVITYKIQNAKRFVPTLSVSMIEVEGATGFARPPLGYLLHTAAGSEATVTDAVVAQRRGMHRFDRLQVSSSFPFGFVRRTMLLRQQEKLLVFPAIGTVDSALMALCRAAEHTGSFMRPRPGGQDEFYGVREHRPGDNPRHIHWRRSARTLSQGVLVAKEMTQVAPPRLMLLVDTWLTDRSSVELARVERAIAMAASVAATALDQDLSVGLFAWTGEWKRIDPSRGKRHRTDLLSLLARLPKNVTQDTSRLLEQGMRRANNGTTAVLCTPRAMPAGLDRQHRGALVVLPAESPETNGWFRWDAEVDFAMCVPADQLPQ